MACLALAVVIGTFVLSSGQHALPSSTGCSDLDPKCSVWANQGECETNSAWMMSNCRRSCHSCQGGEQAWRLRAEIAKHYDSNGTTIGDFSINKLDIVSVHLERAFVNERTQTVEVAGRMVLTWNDPKLTWSKNDWNIEWLNFYWLQIWTPQITQVRSTGNGNLQWTSLGSNYTGQVIMWANFVFTSSCDMDHSRFPHDYHTCCFDFDEKRYFAIALDVTSRVNQRLIDTLGSIQSPGWSVTDVTVNTVKRVTDNTIKPSWLADPFDVDPTQCRLCVSLKRNSNYATVSIVAPAVVTSVLTLVSFLLRDLRRQIWLLVASVALQLFSLSIIGREMPPFTTAVPSIVHFTHFHLAVTATVIVISILLFNMASANTLLPPPRCLDRFGGTLERILPCFPAPSTTSDKQSLDSSATAGGSAWSHVAAMINVLVFLVALVVYVLAMISCLGFI